MFSLDGDANTEVDWLGIHYIFGPIIRQGLKMNFTISKLKQ
jgi:hypothetical protein